MIDVKLSLHVEEVYVGKGASVVYYRINPSNFYRNLMMRLLGSYWENEEWLVRAIAVELESCI